VRDKKTQGWVAKPERLVQLDCSLRIASTFIQETTHDQTIHLRGSAGGRFYGHNTSR
jgi:hypothetical protein